MELELLEGELQHDDDGFGDVALPGVRLVDPVADGADLHGAAHDVVEVDLAGDVLIDEHSEL